VVEVDAHVGGRQRAGQEDRQERVDAAGEGEPCALEDVEDVVDGSDTFRRS
jgi:hypothetical protein